MKLYKNYVRIEMNGFSVFALIDTGAAISCINSKTFEDLKLNQNYDLRDINFTVQGVGGKQTTMGQATVHFLLGGIEFQQLFTIIHDIGIELLLGMDFLSKYSAKLDFVHNHLTIDGSNSPIQFEYREEYKILVDQIIILPPRSESIVYFNAPFPMESPVQIFEPRTSFHEVWNVIPARSLVDNSQGHIYTRILNPTNMQITLVPGTIVGHLESVVDVTQHQAEVHTPSQAEVNAITNDTDVTDFVETLYQTLEIDLSKADASPTEKQLLAKFILDNKSIFAQSTPFFDDLNL